MTDFLKNATFRKFFFLFLGVLLFALDNVFTAWFSALPLFFLIDELNFKNAWIYGGIYGFFCCFFYAFWLFSFSIPAMVCVWILYFFLYAILFEVLKILDRFAEKSAWILYPLVLVLFEYSKTLGFAGFGYGINGYTQYKNLYLIQIADFSGVFGVSFLLYFCSSVLHEVLVSAREKRFGGKQLSLIISLQVLVVFSLVYGFVKISLAEKRDSAAEKITVCAVQHNTNPNDGGFETFRKDVENLMRLSESALDENPEISLVVWPETSVVPSILGNYGNEKRPERNELVTSLLEFIDSKHCAFVIGNFHSENGNDFNSAYFFEGGKNVIPPRPEIYRKIHLVPFSEYLPFSEKLPEVKKYVTSKSNFLWTPGTERKVFSLETEKGVFRFASPICFEDTFGRDLRKFYKNGARSFVNLSNDAWSGSRRCQEQHLKMAVFRSVENHIPSVRSTATGETCVISSSGKITARSAPFEENYVVSEIPVLD